MHCLHCRASMQPSALSPPLPFSADRCIVYNSSIGRSESPILPACLLSGAPPPGPRPSQVARVRSAGTVICRPMRDGLWAMCREFSMRFQQHLPAAVERGDGGAQGDIAVGAEMTDLMITYCRPHRPLATPQHMQKRFAPGLVGFAAALVHAVVVAAARQRSNRSQ